MKYLVFVISFCLIALLGLNAKSFVITGNVQNAENIKTVYLYSFQNGNYKLIDTTDINKLNYFSFQLGNDAVAGIYKIRFSPFLTIENILFNYNDIKLSIDLKDIPKSLKYLESNENEVLLSYLKFINHELNREKSFLYLLGYYSREDEFFEQINNEMKRLKSRNQEIIKDLINSNDFLLASTYIKYDQVPYIAITGNSEKDLEELIKHYWDNIDFSDTLLLNLPLFIEKLDNFFILFENPTMSREEQEKLFAKPAEILLNKSKDYPIINSFIVDKILSDAIQFNLHELYANVAQKIYENDYCINEEKKLEVNKKLDDINKVAIGKPAPNFTITDNLDLYSIKSTNTLIVFWESDCNYCFQKMEDLTKIYKENNNQNFEIVAVCLDKESLTFQRALIERGYKWINISDFKGWASPIVNNYKISSTPAMFLLDKNKKIIAKPVKVEHILNYVENKSN